MVADSDAVSDMLPLVFEVKAGDCPGEARSSPIAIKTKAYHRHKVKALETATCVAASAHH